MTDVDPEIRKIAAFDTTLRDGEQAPGNEMSVANKVELFRKIDAAGLDVIEVGFPSASPIDYEAVDRILRLPRQCKASLFARSNLSDIDTCLSLLDGVENVQIQILATGSEIHLEHKRRMSRRDAVTETRRAVSYVVERGVEVSLALEDSSRGSFDLLEETMLVGAECGAQTILLTDTVGIATPNQFAALVERARASLGASMNISVHCHDDLGLATANSLAGLCAGANEYQGTLCGIGERAGNASLEELTAVLLTHGDRLGFRSDVRPVPLYDACMMLSKVIDFPIARNKSILGRFVYSTAAGIHQDGIAKNPITYEPFDPALFGRARETVISRHSGRAARESQSKANGGYRGPSSHNEGNNATEMVAEISD